MRIPLLLAAVAVCSCAKPAPPAAPAPAAPKEIEHSVVAVTPESEPVRANSDTAKAIALPVDDHAARRSLEGTLGKKVGGAHAASGESMLQGDLGGAVASFGPQSLGVRGAGGGGGGTGLGVGGLSTGYGSGAGRMSGVAFGAVANKGVDDRALLKDGGTFEDRGVNPVVDAREDRFSTFGVDVDSGSWMYARRFLRMGRPPAAASVRVEEFVNAMHYDYAAPKDDAFAIHVDGAPSPFTRDMHVVRVALQGKRLTREQRKPATITFLVDVSGSMDEPDRLPWARDGIRMAVDHLRDDDRVAIVTYAGGVRLVLPATPATEKLTIRAAIDTLVPGGGTNMGSGMELAYTEANKELSSDRTSRVIVMSDGDANIGHTGHDAILRSIRGYVSEGVTLTTMGFGSGNYDDAMMQSLADAGNGNYTYIDSKETLRRFLVDELSNTLEVIAQDTKIQVEWNPDVVKTYRLLGYEKRALTTQDFRNDKKDAGDIGAGHAVTAFYEVSLRPERDASASLGTVRIRHKIPRHEHASEVARAIAATDIAGSVNNLDDDAKAALGMALAAEILRGSEHAQGLSLADAASLLRSGAHGKFASERNEAAALLEKAPVHAVAVRD